MTDSGQNEDKTRAIKETAAQSGVTVPCCDYEVRHQLLSQRQQAFD